MNGRTGAQCSLLRALIGAVAALRFAPQVGPGGQVGVLGLAGLAAALLPAAGWARPLAAPAAAAPWPTVPGAPRAGLSGFTHPLLIPSGLAGRFDA